MSREKNKVTKRISPKNTPSENLKLAQFGEFWDTPEFAQAWHWRYRFALSELGTLLGRGEKAEGKEKIEREIGMTVGDAVAKGDWRYLQSLAKAVEFVAENFDWKVKTPNDLSELFRLDISKFTPVDQLRVLIVKEYFMVSRHPDADVRKTRRRFMSHIESLMPDAICERTFDRACQQVGIRWRKK